MAVVAAAAAVVFATETKDVASLIDGLHKASRQARCGEEEGCGQRRKIREKNQQKANQWWKSAEQNFLNRWLESPMNGNEIVFGQ